jgi:hypothetical protein
MKTYLFTFGAAILFVSSMLGQPSSPIQLDSVYGEQGIPGTLNFAPDFRIYYPSYDEEGRVLETIREKSDGMGNWTPLERRIFSYEGNSTVRTIQVWLVNQREWTNRRRERTDFDDELIQQRTREVRGGDTLRLERRWNYTYNSDNKETNLLLERWNGFEWENLSRKISTYNGAGNLSVQVLQFWFQEDWRNIRRRGWEYQSENTGNFFVEKTQVQVWSVEEEAWINQLQQTFDYEDGRWAESLFSAWDENQEAWLNDDRMLYHYDENNHPDGQTLQRWNGAWENAGRANFSFADSSFLSNIQQWDDGSQDWVNLLRYQVELNQYGRLKAKTGMQAWNQGSGQWENRIFSQRIQYSSSPADIINGVEGRVPLPQSCSVPNPYLPGTSFSCDFGGNQRPFSLELIDAQGRLVLRQSVRSQQTTSINLQVPSGLYVLRVRDKHQLVHLQRIVIP